MKESLSGNDRVYFWDGVGDNPYYGFLALADIILVSEDSVSMTSEAATTGKPVYTIKLRGGGKRLDKFHENLQTKGITRIFDADITSWEYPALSDAQKIAGVLKRFYKQ